MYTASYFQEVPVIRQDQLTIYPSSEIIRHHGFPYNKSGDYKLKKLDLSKVDIKKPDNTYFVQLTEDPFPNTYIKPGNILVIEKDRKPVKGNIVLVRCEGEFIVRRFFIENLYPQLHCQNPEYPTIEVEPDMEFIIWGVVKEIL